jgi:two-component system OmpR family response regulator
MPGAPFRVLLVEDSKRLAERLREALEQLEEVNVVATVDDEKSAVDIARRESIDVMVLDLQLREGTGFGVLKALGDVRPAVIVLTNYALPEYQRRATELGVEYFLNKSRDYEKLPDIILSLKDKARH